MRKICVGEWADEYVGLILCPIEKQRKKVRLGTSEHRTHNGGSHERKEKKRKKKRKKNTYPPASCFEDSLESCMRTAKAVPKV
jgi:hypothetical protein